MYDVFDDKIIATNTRSFRAFVRARTTRLFLWGEGRELAAATGLDLPAQSAEVADAPPVSEPPVVSSPPRSFRDTPPRRRPFVTPPTWKTCWPASTPVPPPPGL